MAARNVLEFVLQADASGLIGPLRKVKGEFEQLDASAQQTGRNVGSGLDQLQSKLSSAGTKMIGVGAALTAATLPLSLMLKSGVDGLVEAERRSAQTAAVLKSTGEAAHVSAEGVTTLVTQLRDLSGVSGGTIRDGANMLLTFTRVRNEVGLGNDIFTQATRSALDMSVAMGEDMKSSSMRLGKALNDPISGLTALRRVGVQFTDTQKTMIQGFVESGDMASAQKVILHELATEFGGSAAAFGETTAGQMEKAKNAFSVVKMELAAGLAPALGAIAGGVQDLGQWFTSLDSDTKRWVGYATIALAASGPVATGLGGLIKGVSALSTGFGKLSTFIGGAGSAGPFGMLAAGVGLATVSLLSYVDMIDSAGRKTVDNATIEVRSFEDLYKQHQRYGEELDKERRKLDELQRIRDSAADDASRGVSIFAGGGGGLPAFKPDEELDRQVSKVNELQDAYAQAGSSIEQYNSFMGATQDATGLSRQQLESLAVTLNVDLVNGLDKNSSKFGEIVRVIAEVSQVTGMSSDRVLALAGAMGLDLQANTDAARDKLIVMAQAMDDTSSAAASAGLNIDQLKQSVEELVMPWLNSEQAFTQFRLQIEQLPGKIQQLADSHGTLTEKGLRTQDMMGQITTRAASLALALQENISKGIDVQGSQQQLAIVYQQTLGALDQLAATGYPGAKEEADKYRSKLDEMRRMGVIITQADFEDAEARRKVDQYKAYIQNAQTAINSILGAGVPPVPPPGARGGVIVDGVAHFARGGMFDRATAIVGEGKGREWVIPEDPAYRGRALGLWRQAGAALMAAGGTVGGDGAAATALGGSPADGSLAVLLQIRDVLVQIASTAAIAPSIGGVGGTPEAGGTPVGGGMASAADSAGVAAAATSGLSDTVAAAGTVVAGFDGQLVQAAAATLPAVTIATQQSDLATQAATATLLAQLPVQAAWQTMLAASKAAMDLLTAATDILIGRLGVLNATQVVLHVDSSQVQSASTSIAHLADTVQSSLSRLGLGTNQLAQWLGVVLALPAGVITSAVGAESGGVVGNVGAGMKGHSPTLVMEGSRAYDEYVIPTDPKHRRNAMGLLAGLHDDLGVSQMASGGVIGDESGTLWGGTAAAVPGTLASVLSGSMIAAAALASSMLSSGGKGVPPYPPGGDAVGSAISWVLANWDVVDGGRYGSRSYYSDHTSGNAFDAMTGDLATGNSLRDWFLANPNWYGTKYTIWQQDIRYPNGSGHRMEDRGGATANHMDHVHISFVHDNAGARGQMGGGTAAGGAVGGAGPVDVPQPWKGVGQYIVDHFARVTGGGVGGSSGPVGVDVPAGARTWHGKISEFGGPGDYQGTAYDGHTRDLYAQRFPFAAMRDRDMANQWVGISAGGGAVKAQILDYGPAVWTGRIIDVSPTVLSDLGVDTDATVDVWQLAEGGKIRSYDRGGWLPEGISLAHNGTGAPEPVGIGGGRPVVVNVTVEGSVTSEADLVDTITRAIRANTRRGAIGVGVG